MITRETLKTPPPLRHPRSERIGLGTTLVIAAVGLGAVAWAKTPHWTRSYLR